MTNTADDFYKLMSLLQNSILRLKNDQVFSTLNFKQLEDTESFLFRINECPFWFNWKNKTISSILGNTVKLDDTIAKRLIENGILSAKVSFPKIEHEGKSIKIEVSSYIYLNKPVYKYNYTTGGFSFGQSNLDFFLLCKNIKSLLTNKPLTRKNQLGGFMQRLNSLSPNFTKRNSLFDE